MKILPQIKYKDFFNHRFFIFFSCVVLITVFFPTGESLEYNIEVGDVWNNKDLVSDFYFPIMKDEAEYQDEIEKTINDVFPVFYLFDPVKEKYIDSCNMFLTTFQKVFMRGRSSVNPTLYADYKNLLDSKTIKQISYEKTSLQKLFVDKTIYYVRYFYNNGILNVSKTTLSKDTIRLRNSIERIHSLKDFFSKREIDSIVSGEAAVLFKDSYDLRTLFVKTIKNFTVPNIIFDTEATEKRKEASAERVSRNTGIVAEDEKIVEKHQRITKDIKRKIDSYRFYKSENAGKINILVQWLGKSLHVFLLILLYIIYIYHFRKQIFFNTKKSMILGSIFVFVSLMAYITNLTPPDYASEYLILLPVGSMLITVLFDSRVGFYGTVILALIVGAIKGNSYTITFINIFAGGLAAYSVKDIISRNQIFRSILYIFTGYFFSILALGMERYTDIRTLSEQILFAAINANLSSVLTTGLLIFIEKTFNITTDLSLSELHNPSQPLIQDLQIKTPGTYHHSLIVSSMAESAALGIGANATLAKLGALYHDIGKTKNPEYFIENRRDNSPGFDHLPPEEYAKLIIGHIEDGLDLASQFKLPKEVSDFIPMHHGTTFTKYFYTIAKKQQKKDFNESLFQYPGPVPGSKETAIVMLADAIESISRSLKDPVRKDFEDLIDSVIKSRFEEKQLDNSHLTFNDLLIIKEHFLKILEGIHHSRVVYPKSK